MGSIGNPETARAYWRIIMNFVMDFAEKHPTKDAWDITMEDIREINPYKARAFFINKFNVKEYN